MEEMLAKGRLHKTFCRNLRAAREQAELTQQQMADRLEVSQPRYAEIEGGRYPPNLEVIERVAAALKIEPRELLDPRFAAAAVA